jgi:prefoldin subunit 5
MKKEISLIIIGAVVTILVSIGGSYITTRTVVAVHEERLNNLEKADSRFEQKLDKHTEILNRVDRTTAILEERTKPKD